MEFSHCRSGLDYTLYFRSFRAKEKLKKESGDRQLKKRVMKINTILRLLQGRDMGALDERAGTPRTTTLSYRAVTYRL